MNEDIKPKEYDLVLGGNNPPPVDGVVLGGIAGVKKRLSSKDFEAKLAAVREALKYDDEGIELIINTLKDSSKQFQSAAARILKQQGTFEAKQALLDYNPYSFFTTLKDWNHVTFNPEIGISDPVNNAYIFNLESLRVVKRGKAILEHHLYKFEEFLNDPKSSEINALICYINYYAEYSTEEFTRLLEIVCDAAQHLPNIKALFLGDTEENQLRKSYLNIFNISPILEAYPNLEILQVRGCFSEYPLESIDFRHTHLKTLIIETADLSDYNLEEICSLDLPELEYLEIWLGRQIYEPVNSLSLILNYDSFPKLKYLGLRSSENSDSIAQAIVNSPILKHLSILDLSMGTLTDTGAEALLNCAEIEQLHTLDISYNAVSEGAIAYLSELDINLIAYHQDDGHRYSTLYE